jgi:hypothetical protein
MRLRWALDLHTFCRMRRKLMLEKKFRHEKVVIGSEGSSEVGIPSSSTAGGMAGPLAGSVVAWTGSTGASSR